MIDILNMPIGPETRTVTVTEIIKEEVKVPTREKPSDIVRLKVVDAAGLQLIISSAWVYNKRKKATSAQILWLNVQEQDEGHFLSPDSPLAELLRYNSVQTLSELVGSKIQVYPEPNGYLAFVACDMQLDLS